MDVRAWLKGLGLEQYAPAFAENDIDANLLKELTAEDLKDLGVMSVGHRKRLLAAMAELEPIAVGEMSAALSRGPPLPAGERRQVTIFFADLCGFTALSQTIDPEELHEFVGRYTAAIDDIVEGYGGSVDKHIGDAVMALFGAPVAHGDDPLRAVRAALDIHVAVAALGTEFGRPLRVHLGIACGEVVAGGLGRSGRQDYTVLGDSVNLAARLVGLAPAGQTLVSDAVHRALLGRANCEAMDDITVKGLKAPVRVWRVCGLAADRSAPRSPFVGRRAELDQFKAILTACLATLSGQAIYVRGEAGIGKTRLLEEMARSATEHGFDVHQALVLDFGAGKGQGAARAVLRSLLGVAPGGDEAARRAASDRALADALVTVDRAAFLNDLLDLPQTTETRALYDAMDNAARIRGKRELLAAVVKATSRRKPILIAVEDLHWADAITLSYLAELATAVQSGPALLVITSRLEGDPLGSAWGANLTDGTLAMMDLGPLLKEEALSLAGTFVDATEAVVLACVERAEGNPLFLEQLLRNAEQGENHAVPPSIQSLVLAHMDRLPVLDKQALQAASAIGQRFDLDTLRHLLEVPDYTCDELVHQALVRPDGEAFLFGHALVQEGVYSSLLKVRRRELHRRAAAWFAERDPVLRAEHLDRAEDVAAAQAYGEAAEAQKVAYHYERALQLADRGIAIAAVDGDRHALMCSKGELLHDLGEISASIDVYRCALAMAPDELGRCRSWIGLAAGLRVSEGLAEALELLDRAEEVANRHELVAELARIHHLRGNIYFPLGRIDGCREEHERGLACARQAGSSVAEARALGGLADAAYAQGRMRTAFKYFSRCVALSREHGFGRIEVANRSMIGFSRQYLNDLRGAVEDGLEAAASAARVGHQRAEMLGETMCVLGCYELGEFDAAEEHRARELRLARRLGARRFEAQNLEIGGRILFAQGRRTDAVRQLEQALRLCREVGLQFSGPRAIGALAAASEDPAERRRWLDDGEAVLQRGAVGHNHLWFYRDAMEAMLQAGDVDGALRYAAALKAYTRPEPLPWSDLFIARARALVTVASSRGGAGSVKRDLEVLRKTVEKSGLRLYRSAIDSALHAIIASPTIRSARN